MNIYIYFQYFYPLLLTGKSSYTLSSLNYVNEQLIIVATFTIPADVYLIAYSKESANGS